MPELRVLDRITRQMQRLGYLKRLIKRVTTSSTSSLEFLGLDLVDTAARRISSPINNSIAQYIKVRLYDRVYTNLKKQANDWIINNGDPPVITMELQDLYLSDPSLPSGVGKLVKEDWKHYPPLGVSLGFIREGTYSANTRAYSLLFFTPENEQKAFTEYLPKENPLCISMPQGLLLLYSFLENDGEVVIPLWKRLSTIYYSNNSEISKTSFNDRDAGDLLPEIYHNVISQHRSRILTADARERLNSLERSAESISRQLGVERYAGGTAREHSSRPRLEPYVDIGLISKPDPLKYEYILNPIGHTWAQATIGVETSQDVGSFLASRFFTTAANAWEITAQPIYKPEDIVPHLQRAWKAISSASGYAPIEEIAVVAGIEGLLHHNVIIEHAIAKQALITHQKANPYMVRFMADRFGVLAHVKFLETAERL